MDHGSLWTIHYATDIETSLEKFSWFKLQSEIRIAWILKWWFYVKRWAELSVTSMPHVLSLTRTNHALRVYGPAHNHRQLCSSRPRRAPSQSRQDPTGCPARGYRTILPGHLLHRSLLQDNRLGLHIPQKLLSTQRLEHHGLHGGHHRLRHYIRVQRRR